MTDLAQDLAFLSDEDNKSPMEDMDDSDIGEMDLETARVSLEPPSSPELHCVGCDISSKADCPIGKLMKKRKVVTTASWLKSSGARPPHAVCGRRARKDAVTRTNLKDMWGVVQSLQRGFQEILAEVAVRTTDG